MGLLYRGAYIKGLRYYLGLGTHKQMAVLPLAECQLPALCDVVPDLVCKKGRHRDFHITHTCMPLSGILSG